MIDLFAGTGAFSFVSNQFGIECVFANDISQSSKDFYDLNHKNKLIKKDINDIDCSTIEPFDLLCAGFPCQPFSIAGCQNGFEDKRANVFWTMLDLIKYHNPRFMILENVKNLISHNKGKTFDTIKNNIENLGYNIKYKILNTCKLTNIPQNRERVYIVCFRDKKDFDVFNFDFEPSSLKPVKDFIDDKVDEKYYYNQRYKIYEKLKDYITEENTFYQYRRFYVRKNKHEVCPTLTANMGSGGHNVPLILTNKRIRKLTPMECFRLQGFTDFVLPNISDAKLYSLAGNAVSIPVIFKLIKKIYNIQELNE